MTSMAFTEDEVERYARHLVLSEVGGPGQQALKRARVLIVGAGGVGGPAALYLAAAGVGTLGLIDHDAVALSNLQRQILFDTADVGRPKVEAAAMRLEGLNPHVAVQTFAERLTAENALARIEDFDLVLDGTDDFETRFLVNAACVVAGDLAGLPSAPVAVAGAVACFLLRYFAIRRGWRLPVAGSR